MAVVTALVQGLEPGDHILAPSDVYYGIRQVIGGVFGKWPFETTYVDMTDLDAVRAAVRPATRLVIIETPSNPLMKITDLAAVAAIARQANAISVCDGTFTTPVLQRPLDCGVDMVMHSTTKYIGGHSDLVGGALVTRYDNYLFERARKSLQFGGAVPSRLRLLAGAARRQHAALAHARAFRKRAADRGVPLRGTLRSSGCIIRACPIIPATRSRPGRCRDSAACSPSRCAAGGRQAMAVAPPSVSSRAPPAWADRIA